MVALRQPIDYSQSQGARLELHFEKERGLSGADVEPIEARLGFTPEGRIRWNWAPLRLTPALSRVYGDKWPVHMNRSPVDFAKLSMTSRRSHRTSGCR